MKTVRIVEIDDNNNSNIFKDVDFEAVSVTTKEGDEALQDALFDQMADDCSICLDSGGGNDARKVLKMLEDMNEADNFTYIIPVGNSRAQVQNAKDTHDLIARPEQCIFILNQVHNVDELEQEFLFFFGSKDLGVKPLFKLNDIKYIPLEYTPSFELAAMNGKTIFELAQISYDLKDENIREKFFQQSNGDKMEFNKLYSRYKQSLKAYKYLASNYHQLEELLKNSKNVALVSTKGGVGKSTLAWHLITQVLKGE